MKNTLKILVVDEFPSMRRIVKNVLAELGLTEIGEAEDGDTALPMLQLGSFDLLVTDLNMPGMNGLELLGELRSDRRLAAIPVLMVSASVTREQMIEASKLGVNDFLIKPFSAEVLKEKLEKLIPEHESEPEPETEPEPELEPEPEPELSSDSQDEHTSEPGESEPAQEPAE